MMVKQFTGYKKNPKILYGTHGIFHGWMIVLVN